MLDIYEEFRNLVAVLEEHEIDYALCGGMAMAVHERPRMTIDIDILIQAESLDRVIDCAETTPYERAGFGRHQSFRGRRARCLRLICPLKP
jgi:hypothetical protein